MTENTIDVIGLEDISEDRDRFPGEMSMSFIQKPVPVSILEGNLKSFVHTIQKVIQGLPAALGEYNLDTIEINAEISASGKVSLLGIGGDLGGKGGITFTLKRTNSTNVSE